MHANFHSEKRELGLILSGTSIPFEGSWDPPSRFMLCKHTMWVMRNWVSAVQSTDVRPYAFSLYRQSQWKIWSNLAASSVVVTCQFVRMIACSALLWHLASYQAWLLNLVNCIYGRPWTSCSKIYRWVLREVYPILWVQYFREILEWQELSQRKKVWRAFFLKY